MTDFGAEPVPDFPTENRGTVRYPARKALEGEAPHVATTRPHRDLRSDIRFGWITTWCLKLTDMRAISTFRRNRFFRISPLILASVCLVMVVFKIAQKKEPIKIGLATTLTGIYSTSGAHARNGAMLAVEQINKAGGINGRPVELLIRNDKADPEEALRVDQELIDEGVVAIIGHVISTLSTKTVPLMNEKNVLMVGNSSTAELSGLDDNFIRTVISVNRQAPLTADLAYQQLNLRTMVSVHDLSNAKLAESFFQYFKEGFDKLGGEISGVVTFDPRKEFSATAIAQEIMSSGAEGLLLVANAIHGALICQHLRKKGASMTIVDSGWAIGDPDFISNGGRAVNGVMALAMFAGKSSSEPSARFSTLYERRFGEKISEAAQDGYEAAHVLFSALSKTDDPTKLKKIILEQKVFQGADGKIMIDAYGDVIRTMYTLEILNGKVEVIDTLVPSEPQ